MFTSGYKDGATNIAPTNTTLLGTGAYTM